MVLRAGVVGTEGKYFALFFFLFFLFPIEELCSCSGWWLVVTLDGGASGLMVGGCLDEGAGVGCFDL